LLQSQTRHRIPEGDITEDGRIDESTTMLFRMKIPPTAPDHTLLYSPLPSDLPALYFNKDVLILMAAYNGNIDRYARLKRPHFVRDEIMCVVRGIYHNTPYAKWWEGEIQSGAERYNSWDVLPYVRAAISARYLMENNMHHLLAQSVDYLPFQIWYPRPPCEAVLRALLVVRPQMKYPVAHACLVGGYRKLWDELNITPDRPLVDHAADCLDTYFREDIDRRIAALEEARKGDLNVPSGSLSAGDPRARAFTGFRWECSTDLVEEGLTPWAADTHWREGPYDGLLADVQKVGLYVCAPDWLKRYTFLKRAGPMDTVYWKNEDEMHKELEDDGETELSTKIKEMAVGVLP
jgi:hypothetical protein